MKMFKKTWKKSRKRSDNEEKVSQKSEKSLNELTKVKKVGKKIGKLNPNHHLFKIDKGRVVRAVVTGGGAQSPQTFLTYTSQLYLFRHLKYKLCAMKNIGQNTHFQ